MDIDLGLFEGIEGADELLAEILQAETGGTTFGGAEGDSSDDSSDGLGGGLDGKSDGGVNGSPDGGLGAEPGEGMGGSARTGSVQVERPTVGTLFIDADACPVTREALAEARRARVPVVIAGNTTQNLERHIRPDDPRDPADARPRARAHASPRSGPRAGSRPGFWVDTLVAGVGSDSADFAIVERLQPGDVVVTQDIGLAGMCLGRGAAAIGVRGRVYDRATIDSQLFIRHEEKKARRHGERTAGPAPFTDEDRRRFSANLRRLLEG